MLHLPWCAKALNTNMGLRDDGKRNNIGKVTKVIILMALMKRLLIAKKEGHYSKIQK